MRAVFGQVPRIVFASVCAFWAGEFVNAYVLARMKIWTGGRHLWSRTIGSTIVRAGGGQPDLLPARLLGRDWLDPRLVLTVMVTNWALKVGWEVLLTPGDLRGGRLR